MTFRPCETPALFCFLTVLLNAITNPLYFLGAATHQAGSEGLQSFSESPPHLRVTLLGETMRPFTAQALSTTQKVSVPRWNLQISQLFFFKICVELLNSSAERVGAIPWVGGRTGANGRRQDKQKTAVCLLKSSRKPSEFESQAEDCLVEAAHLLAACGAQGCVWLELSEVAGCQRLHALSCSKRINVTRQWFGSVASYNS